MKHELLEQKDPRYDAAVNLHAELSKLCVGISWGAIVNALCIEFSCYLATFPPEERDDLAQRFVAMAKMNARVNNDEPMPQ